MSTFQKVACYISTPHFQIPNMESTSTSETVTRTIDFTAQLLQIVLTYERIEMELMSGESKSQFWGYTTDTVRDRRSKHPNLD